MVKHKMLGMGKVVNKEVIGEHTYITVQFENEKEMRFAIPVSFETGVVEAVGTLKDEVERAIAEKQARLAAATAPAIPTRSRTSKMPSVGPDTKAFEQYLIHAGYKEETDEGAPSTVYSYLNAVESVRAEEGISWSTLKTNIAQIVSKYDEGGEMSWFGAKSNKRIINALRRYAEFVHTP